MTEADFQGLAKQGCTLVPVVMEALPACLEVSAQSEEGEIMGLRHRTLPVEGVQFHPEAMLTEHGHAMLKNFLEGRRQ